MENKSDIGNWVRELNNVGSHEETLVILKEIFIKFRATDETPSITTLLSTIDNLTTSENGDKFYYEHIYKTYFRVHYKMNQTTLGLEQKFQTLSNSLKNAFINAIFSSEYYKIINVNLIFNLCYKYLNETSASYTKYSISSLRLMALFAKNFNSFLLPSHDLWKLIYLNLDAPFNNSREQCMSLLDLIIKSDLNFTKVLFNELINFWSWTNKFKYYILTLIFNNYSFYFILNEYQNINIEFFLSGIKISLKYKHLLPASQTLIKCLLKQNIYELNLIFIDIINYSTQYEFSNFLHQWTIHFNDTHDLFELLDLDALEFNRRLISIRLLFQNDFVPDDARLNQIDCFILDQIGNENYACEYQHIFDIFVSKLQKNLNAENIENLMLILKNLYNLSQPSLRQNILKKMSMLFDFLVKMYYTNDTDRQGIIRNFIKFLKQNVFHLKDPGNYQALIFGLKFYEILVKLFSNNIKLRINKNSNMLLNKKFYDEVFASEWDLYTPVTNRDIYFLISNEYDDVRDLALNIITNYYLKSSNNPQFDYRADCLRALNSINTSQSSNAHLYCCLYLNSESDIDEFYKLLNNQLNTNFENFKLDSLWSIQNGQHLLGIINCLNEFIKLQKAPDLMNMADLISVIDEISDFKLNLLNMAGKNKSDAPDFETMDESLQKLIEQSKWESNDDACSRKLLLLSIWLTLKACGDIATAIGIYILQNQIKFDKFETIGHIRNCLKINLKNLYKCRHKGVIEATGISLGVLVKYITSNYKPDHEYYKILYDCFPILFRNVENTSNTRRGAGFSIMLHHLIKNDMQNDRPLLTYAIRILLGDTKLKLADSKCNGINTENVDSLQASMLHYLCVLVKDSDLREDVMPYMERIVQMSFDQIKSDEWKIRNAALQLFGAIIPKLLGQRQQFEDENDTAWEPVYISLDEIIIKMPNLNNYILNYFNPEKRKSYNSSLKSTSSIILFLEFLTKVEVRKVTGINQTDYIFKYNEILWNLLSHKCEKVRILSAKCLSLYHEFRLAIPITIENIIQLLFKIPSNRENFLFSLINTIVFMVIKYQNDINFIKNDCILTNFLNEIRASIRLCYEQNSTGFHAERNFYSFYLRYNFLKLFLLLKYDRNENFIAAILFYSHDFKTSDINSQIMANYNDRFNKFIGYDLWQKNVASYYSI